MASKSVVLVEIEHGRDVQVRAVPKQAVAVLLLRMAAIIT